MIVVGIGASAGGLEALLPFVSHLSPDTGMSFIVAQHGAAGQPSLLAELLRKASTLPVDEAENDIRLEANKIYVAPHYADISIDNGHIKLTRPTSREVPKASIDYFFKSLAESCQEKAIAIVFSGAGSDGANGLKAVKAAGGITMAQRPESAKFSSMPKVAIERADVDLIVEPEEAAERLTAIARNLENNLERNLTQGTQDAVNLLIDRILSETGMDFVNYKSSTINRQIHRRMAILQIEDFDAYVRHCLENTKEMVCLANSFLVCVTSFFRDEQSFEALRKALKTILQSKSPGDEIRIWVPGCATGEEVYSIAMLLMEELGATISRYRVQIYGTDINARAVQIARRGEYGELALHGLSRQFRDKYFVPLEQGFSVSRSLRDLVIFSRQDLIKNPPFIRLDLISCRNLLIYLNQTLQEQVLKIFHYALVNNGILFLGQAESLWNLNDAFTRLDRNNKVFVKNSTLVIRPDFNPKKVIDFALSSNDGASPVYSSYKVIGQDKLLERYVPPSILSTREGRVLEFYNHCDDFIKIRQGTADFNLFSIIDPAFKTELKAFCHQALSENKPVKIPPLTLTGGGINRQYRILITPLYHQQVNDCLLLISFEPMAETSDIQTPDHDTAQSIIELKHQLQTTRETLRTVTEALDHSVGEWQILNEEAQATNEELQSANEELETSNEELQSINEELSLVNDELTVKSKELGDLNDDLGNILESIGVAVIVIDNRMRITRYNAVGQRFLQFNTTIENNPTISSLEMLFGRENLVDSVREVIRSRQSVQLKKEKQGKHYELTFYPYRRLAGNEVTGAVLTIEDITEQFLTEQQIRLSASVFDAANEAIVITDENNRIISVNPAFSEITGYSKSEVLGKDPKILNSGKQTKSFYRNLWHTLEETGSWQGEIWNKRKNGEIYPEWLSISALKEAKGAVSKYVGIFADIGESLRAQKLIHQQANFDVLTQLPNRNLFYDRLQQAIVKAQRERKLFGLMFIDLDGFKEINDALGHSLGDRVLQEVAARMAHVFRESDTFARFGGDEFTVLVPNLESETDMIAPTEKILEAIQMPIQADDHELNITASVGITVYPNDGSEAETLLKNADNAMYSAKAEGRNVYRFFTQEMHEKAQRQHRVVNDIKNAVKFERFLVYYQPVIDLQSQRLCGAEALIRWQHPVRGFISPDEFIPVAESLNLIGQIGEFVLAKACHFIADLNNELGAELSIAVNFSSLQFVNGSGVDKWLDMIDKSGIGANNFVVEITESLMMSHKEHYIRQLQKLRSQGIKIALDDFGTGFSSLSYLKQLPVDIIKIDRTFIRDILVDSSDASLVESILDIANNFRLEVIAEGVEDAGQAEFLKSRPCAYAQGYYFSKPLPEEQFRQFALGKSCCGEIQ